MKALDDRGTEMRPNRGEHASYIMYPSPRVIRRFVSMDPHPEARDEELLIYLNDYFALSPQIKERQSPMFITKRTWIKPLM
jgi:hypothetical protein